MMGTEVELYIPKITNQIMPRTGCLQADVPQRFELLSLYLICLCCCHGLPTDRIANTNIAYVTVTRAEVE